MKTLEEFDFKTTGTRTTYDWDLILDNEVHELENKIDFKCMPATVKQRAKTVAKEQGLKVRVEIVGGDDKANDGNVVIQSYTDDSADFDNAVSGDSDTEPDEEADAEEQPKKRRRKTSE